MTHEEAVNDLSTIKEFFEQESGAYPVSLEYAIKVLKSEPSADRPQDDDWEKYSDKLWKNAYERGKADRPQGEWIDAEIPLESGGSMPIQACSLCKIFYPLAYTGGGHRFCPNCGARMKGADDNRDYERAAEQREYDMLYESTYNPEDGSM